MRLDRNSQTFLEKRFSKVLKPLQGKQYSVLNRDVNLELQAEIQHFATK